MTPGHLMGATSACMFLLFPSLEKDWHFLEGLLKSQETVLILEVVGETRKKRGEKLGLDLQHPRDGMGKWYRLGGCEARGGEIRHMTSQAWRETGEQGAYVGSQQDGRNGKSK